MSTDADFAPPIEDFDAAGFIAGLPGVLFADDFDLPPPAPVARPAPPPPPPITPEELAAARADGFSAGHAAALATTAHATAQATQQACAALATACAAAPAAAQHACAEAADAAARALLQALASVLPELCAEHGPREAAALAAALLPSLAQTASAPAATLAISANTATMEALQDVIARQGAAVRGSLRLETRDSMAAGDLTLHWPDGAATRGTGQLLRGLAEALAPLGIAVPQPTPLTPESRAATQKPSTAAARAQTTTRELVDV